jgi:branched-chain amino acid aminotransferase
MGTMSVNPYKCKRPELYIMIYEMPDKWLRKERYPARVRISKVPMKDPFFATIKSCNYLPNVLMKKEAVDCGVDFVVAIDKDGNLGEGATENFAIVTTDRQLLTPPLDTVLMGTTVQRVVDLASALVESGDLACAGYSRVTPLDVASSAEMLIVGTTRDILPVSEFEGRKIGLGSPGPIYKKLLKLLRNDMYLNPGRRFTVFNQ